MGRQKLLRVTSTCRTALHTSFSTSSLSAQHGTVAGAEASTSGRKTELVWRQTRQSATTSGHSFQAALPKPQQVSINRGMSTQVGASKQGLPGWSQKALGHGRQAPCLSHKSARAYETILEGLLARSIATALTAVHVSHTDGY